MTPERFFFSFKCCYLLFSSLGFSLRSFLLLFEDYSPLMLFLLNDLSLNDFLLEFYFYLSVVSYFSFFLALNNFSIVLAEASFISIYSLVLSSLL